MHEKKDWTLEDLISHVKIEEANRLKDKRISHNSGFSRANFVEPRYANFDRFKNKGRRNYKSDYKLQGKVQKYKFMGKCHESGRHGIRPWIASPRKEEMPI